MTDTTIFAGLNVPVLELKKIESTNDQGICGCVKPCTCTSENDVKRHK